MTLGGRAAITRLKAAADAKCHDTSEPLSSRGSGDAVTETVITLAGRAQHASRIETPVLSRSGKSWSVYGWGRADRRDLAPALAGRGQRGHSWPRQASGKQENPT